MTAVVMWSVENNIGYSRSNYQHRFHWYRRFLRAAANFAARKQPKLDFSGIRNVLFEKCSFIKPSWLLFF